jgi:hypothetical protein
MANTTRYVVRRESFVDVQYEATETIPCRVTSKVRGYTRETFMPIVRRHRAEKLRNADRRFVASRGW